MQTLRKMAVSLVFATGLGITALAADQPKLKIESPQNGAAITAAPGSGNVVMIRFKTEDFKIISLRDAMKDTNASQNASAQSGSLNDTMSATNPSPSPAGPTPGAPTPMAGGSSAGAGTDLPQSDQPASVQQTSNVRKDRGFIHVTLDNQSWFWVHSTNDPIVIAGIPDGQHMVKLELVGTNHAPTGVSQTVTFTVGRGTR